MIRIENSHEDASPKAWDILERTGDSHLALCIACFRKVTRVETIEDLKARSEIGEKAAIDVRSLNN